jgi:hypothetical protein
VVVLGINAGPDPIDDLTLFVETFQISFPVLLDDQGVRYAYQQGGAVSPFPLDYVIDPAGDVAYVATEYDPEAMTDVIDSLLQSSTPAPDTPGAPSATLAVQPNPFNPRTEVRLDLPAAGPVTLDLHDARGRRIRRILAADRLAAGGHTVALAGRDARGRPLPSGVYLLVLRAAGDRVTHKLTLVR